MSERAAWIAALLSALTGGTPLHAAGPADYLRDVKPILSARCYGCHGAVRQKGGLRLDTAELARRGGDSGPAFTAGKSADSLLIARVTGAEGLARMPPARDGAPLTAAEIAALRSWIDQGAKAPPEPVPPDPRRHWAFRPPERPAVPRARDPRWGRNPVDGFLAAAHQRQGLKASPPVSKDLLLRRVYLDLVGLPPTRGELHAFRADPSPDAYERVVDRLLASPQYGERWGRHWMDVWRYSDWYGLGAEVRYSHRHIWKWRDWIIESLNADKGYDRMVLEMLAGDELAPADPDTLRATGFLVRNWYIFNRNFWLDDVVQHTARGFLGLTLQCARCHDHKYDPLAQQDYYRFRAFFEPHHVRVDRVPGEPDREKAGLSRVFDAFLDAPTYLFVRGDENHPDKTRPLPPGVPAVLGGELEITPVPLPRAAYCPDKQDFVVREALAAGAAEVARAHHALPAAERAAAGRVAMLPPPNVPALALYVALARRSAGELELARLEVPLAEARQAALGAVVRAEALEDAGRKDSDEWRRWARAAAGRQRRQAVLSAREALAAERQAAACGPFAAEQALAAAEAAARQPATTAYTPRPLAFPRAKMTFRDNPGNDPYPKVSTGRRLALARWIVGRHNPLAARVAVNHVWARHFGEPLVSPVFDFGLRTPRPVHHELLDWLAVEFMESGWSLKHLHRLLVTSAAYRMRSGGEGPDDPNRTRDPDNRYLWRMNQRRLEGEVVRDSLLRLAGKLDLRPGGPELPVAAAEAGNRRTVYYRYARDDRLPFLGVFDAASVEECYRRHETIVPQQALAMANGRMTLTRAGEVAAAITREVGAEDTPPVRAAFITAAFEHVLGRAPTAGERAECEAALAELTALFVAEKRPGPSAHGRARASLVHVLLNHNDFITVR